MASASGAEADSEEDENSGQAPPPSNIIIIMADDMEIKAQGEVVQSSTHFEEFREGQEEIRVVQQKRKEEYFEEFREGRKEIRVVQQKREEGHLEEFREEREEIRVEQQNKREGHFEEFREEREEIQIVQQNRKEEEHSEQVREEGEAEIGVGQQQMREEEHETQCASSAAAPDHEVGHERIANGERLQVHLGFNAGEATLCTVYIDRKEEKTLPNYGGFRDIRNGVHYLNAIAQTEWEKKKKTKKEGLITREILKAGQKLASQQTDREAWTQMDRPGVILENRGDYVLIPGPYFNSEDWDEVRLEAVIIIQKYVRRSIARRTAHRMRAYARERREFWEEQERIRKQEADEHLKFEIQRRMNPRSGDDFEILYTELATWCTQEVSRINASGVTGMERRKAIKGLLLKEIKLLQTIDKLRCRAARENQKERISAALTKMCVPKIWELTNGGVVHVRTLGTARASDLMHLYHALAKGIGTNDERMGVLGYVKWTVQVFHSSLTREILELIEREADLMMRGRPANSLVGLRKRILNLFLQFVETPEYNPEAASQQYVPVDFDYGVNSQPTRKRGLDHT